MENYLGMGVGIIAIVSAFLVQSAFLFKTSLSIAVICLIVALTNGFEADPSLDMICFTLIGMIALGYLISLLPEKIRMIAPYFIGLLALIPIGAKANYQGFEVNWTFEVAVFAIIGSIIPLFAKIKDWFAERWFGADKAEFSTAVLLVYLGIFVFVASFMVSTFGVILLAVGFFAANLALRSNNGLQMGILLFAVAWIFYSLNSLDGISDSLLKGNLWMGILAGLGALWACKSIRSEKARIFLSLFLPILIIGILVSFGLINENFGGMPTYLGAIIGTSLALTLIEQPVGEKPFQGMLLPLILIGFTNPVDSFLQREKLKVETLLEPSDNASSNQSSEKKNVMEIPAIALTDGDAGAWKSVPANSKLEFEVGPGSARTSGAIKDFSVDLQLDKAGVLKSLNVEMKSSSLTTFNDIRDESVLSDEFIESEKYPKITFQSKKIQKVGEDYKITGDLDFVGAKAEVTIDLRFVSKVDKDGNTALVFVGKSVVDRTQHNMTSDSKIGDKVDVTFEVAVVR